MKTAIFLGAGASAAEGAPVQSQLFARFFDGADELRLGDSDMKQELAEFFKSFFGLDVSALTPSTTFPTFEEVLGLIDIAEARKDGLREFALDGVIERPGRLRMIRQYLVLMMASVIREHLRRAHGVHRDLVGSLKRECVLDECLFMTTNYDILLDNALLDGRDLRSIDYGVEFTSLLRGGRGVRRPDSRATKLFKLHGSLNWLYCATCRQLALTPAEKGAVRLIEAVDDARCIKCRGILSTIVVPPTFFKDVSNIFLANVWHKAELALGSVQHIVFCGYSFPDADLHIKYMLKRVQTNGGQKMRFTVINDHPGKPPTVRTQEEERFRRFLGDRVKYTDRSFEAFATDPTEILHG